jgi:hypothetical protein
MGIMHVGNEVEFIHSKMHTKTQDIPLKCKYFSYYYKTNSLVKILYYATSNVKYVYLACT